MMWDENDEWLKKKFIYIPFEVVMWKFNQKAWLRLKKNIIIQFKVEKFKLDNSRLRIQTSSSWSELMLIFRNVFWNKIIFSKKTRTQNTRGWIWLVTKWIRTLKERIGIIFFFSFLSCFFLFRFVQCLFFVILISEFSTNFIFFSWSKLHLLLQHKILNSQVY